MASPTPRFLLRAVPLAFTSVVIGSVLLAGCGDDKNGSGNAGTSAQAGTSSGSGGNAGSTTGGTGASSATGGGSATGGSTNGGTGASSGDAGTSGASARGGTNATGGTGGTATGGTATGGTATGATGGTSGGSGTAGSGSVGDHPAGVLYAAICDLYRACCETAGYIENVFTMCNVSAGATAYQDSIDEGHLSIDDTALASCAAHLRTTYAGCDSVLGFADTFTSFPDCVNGIAGAVPLGAECSFDEECVGGGDGHVACVNGICADVPVGTAGDPCVQTKGPRTTHPIPSDLVMPGGAECRRQDGLYCHADSDTEYTCAPVLADGDPCEDEEQCGASSYCTGTCVAFKARDESCTSNSECGPLYCNKDSLTCTNLPDKASCTD